MRYLGVNEYSHDTSVALIDGTRLLCIEEERLSGKKHASGFMDPSGDLPVRALAMVSETDANGVVIVLGWDLGLWGMVRNALAQCRNYKRMDPYDRYSYLRLASRTVCRYCTRSAALRRLGTPIHRVPHHLAHASSAYRCSEFSKALILVMDGAGEREWLSVFIGEGNEIRQLAAFGIAGSLGNVYTFATKLVGFGDFSEGKFMGLAGYGKPGRRRFIRFDTARERFMIDYAAIRRYARGRHRLRSFRQRADVAATFQRNIENALFSCITHYIGKTGIRDVCIAGGIGLNCVLNGRLLQMVDRLYVPSFTNDAGTSLGAALQVAAQERNVYRLGLAHAFLGPRPGGTREALRSLRGRYVIRRIINDPRPVARLLAAGKIVGVCRGRLEFGPRALGNRSILADPARQRMRARLNSLKGRESWRPFGCAVLKEHTPGLFGRAFEAPFMNVALQTIDTGRLAAAIHADGSVRVQTIGRENPRLRSLLMEFYRITGNPALINTSLNGPNQPLISDARDAAAFFDHRGLDALVIGDCLVTR